MIAPAATPAGHAVRALVVTVVHDPEDARIRYREIPAMLAAGFEVTYAAPFGARGRAAPSGVTAVDLPAASGRRRLHAVRAARRLLRQRLGRDDIVLLHDPDLLLSVALLPRRGTAVVWDVHEDTAAALGMRLWLPAPLRTPARLAIRIAELWAERSLHLLLAEEGYASRFRRSHPVVPNSVPVPAAEPPAPGSERVVYVGRLTRSRGAAELVDLGRLLRDQGVQVELTGPADRDAKATLDEAAAAGDVIWHGFRPNDEALESLAGALAGLSLLQDQPNYTHSRPTKVMEYMSCGLPVITTPNAASAELVARHECGVVVPFKDVTACRDAVLRLRDDPPLRRDLAARGRQAALQHYDWRHDGKAFAALLAGWAGPHDRSGVLRGLGQRRRPESESR